MNAGLDDEINKMAEKVVGPDASQKFMTMKTQADAIVEQAQSEQDAASLLKGVATKANANESGSIEDVLGNTNGQVSKLASQSNKLSRIAKNVNDVQKTSDLLGSAVSKSIKGDLESLVDPATQIVKQAESFDEKDAAKLASEKLGQSVGSQSSAKLTKNMEDFLKFTETLSDKKDGSKSVETAEKETSAVDQYIAEKLKNAAKEKTPDQSSVQKAELSSEDALKQIAAENKAQAIQKLTEISQKLATQAQASQQSNAMQAVLGEASTLGQDHMQVVNPKQQSNVASNAQTLSI